MPRINGVLETGLFVEKLSRSRDFYQEVVGLEKLKESEDGSVFVVAKGQLLLLISDEKARVPSKTPGGEVPPCITGSRQILGAGHIAFSIADKDFEWWRSRLKTNHIEVLSEVVWEGGSRSLYFRDPDGHLLELATPGLWGLDW
jgi:catechol 2,3-dioxygenase-like lactoylglutathione lyase family enzyme